jgi:hypothetical protein
MTALTHRLTLAQEAAASGRAVARLIAADSTADAAIAGIAEQLATYAAREGRAALGETTMQRVCCYCRRVFGTADGCGRRGVTHGVCDTCIDTVLPPGDELEG